MAENLFLESDDVANMLGISKAHAYKIMQQLNDELAQKGYITISGRVSKQYFNEKIYGANSQIAEQKGA